MLYAILIAILLIADQWVKYWTTINIVLETGEAEFIPGFVSLVNVHNTGAAFGFLNSVEYMRWIFAGIAIVVSVVLVIIMIRRVFPGKFPMILCAVAIAGALGNCIDRFIYGYVVDMFKLEFLNFYIFNVADILLTVSCFLFIFYLLFGYKDNEKAEDEQASELPGDEGIELAGIESTGIEEGSPAKPIEIDNAFWAAEKEPVKKAPVKKAESDAPAGKKVEPIEPALDIDEFSLDSILNEFK